MFKRIKNDQLGFTLMEMIIYSTLLSFLLTGFFYYSYFIHDGDVRLIQKIEDEGRS